MGDSLRETSSGAPESTMFQNHPILDRETNKQLLLKHIRDNAEIGTPLKELLQVLPGHTRGQVKVLMQELKDERLAFPVGERRWARWFLGDGPPKP